MKIKSIKKIDYKDDVYNLHIKDNHNYFANGVCVSNCHKSGAKSYRKLLKRTINYADYRWGMSGTFPDDDSYEITEILAKTGPVLKTVTARYLMDRGYLTEVKIKGILLNHNDYEFRETLERVAARDKKACYDLEVAKVQESTGKLNVINKIVKQCKDNTLVLFHNTDYGEKLLKYLEEKNPDKDFHFISGKINNKKRSIIKEKMKETTKDIEYTILNFGDYEIEIQSETDILLSCGKFKKAKNITIDDNIDDNFILKLKQEYK